MGNTPQKPEDKKDDKDTTKSGGGSCGNHGCGCH